MADMGPLGQCDNPIVRSHHSSLTSHGTRSSTLMLNPRILSTRPKQAARTNLEFYLTESGRKMQRTTINSYPHLVEIKPIKGIVYKASNILRPQPTISVMPIYEVQMHQKQEGVTAVMQKDKPQSKLFRLKKRLGHECMLCSVSESSSTLPEDLESLPPPIPLVQQPNAQKALGGKAIKSLRKWKKVWKEVFHPKSNSISPDGHGDDQTNSQLGAKPALKPGFRCAKGGCEECLASSPSTPT